MMNKILKVLVACEESQRVCSAFRELGHEAYSCDIIDCSGDHPEWHIKQDVLPILSPTEKGIDFSTVDGTAHHVDRWDLIIAHPPCTYLTNTGNRWFDESKYGEKARQRKLDRELAAAFFMEFINADCDHIVVENPIGCMSTRYKKPSQIIQPYEYGHHDRKSTCLWIKGLPNLKPTEIVDPQLQKMGDGKLYSEWHIKTFNMPKEERAKERSKTFPGIAAAMANQWSEYLCSI